MKTDFAKSGESLWRDFITGNPDAFEALADRFYTPLFHYGTKFSRDRELVKDCIQDVFLNVWEKRLALDADIPPLPYLFASLRRRIHRKADREKVFTGAVEELHFLAEFSVEEHLIESEAGRELSRRFAALLNELPPRQKEIVLLKYFENLSREEIALVMQITPQSVSNTLQKSLNWLRSHWLTLPVLLLFWSCKYFYIFFDFEGYPGTGDVYRSM